jgi:hypothetical protein
MKNIFAAAAELAIGFLAGREEMKYEITSAFRDLGKAVMQNFGKAVPSVLPPPSLVTPSSTERPPAPRVPEPPSIGIKLLKKGFKPSDLAAHDFEDDITLNLELADLTNQDIRAFDGTVIFTDLLDNEIMSIRLAVNDPIKAGATINWQGGIRYNQFIDRHQRLRDAEEQNMKVKFETKKILFADGTTKEFSYR